jgi:23S rRNA pseudouridine1911/1915/1917 synthase
MPLDILFEDEDIIALNKPAGIVIHAGNGTMAPTLVEGILSHCKLSPAGGNLRPGVVHRLDKNTSGAMIFAKTDAAYLRLVKMFAARKIKKTYLAIVRGIFERNFGEIDLPIGRNRTVRTKMAVSPCGKTATTRWHVLKTFGRQFTFLQVNILTGRTHQIRVHLSSIHHPIVGDTTYGYSGNYSPLIAPDRVMLHASELAFKHPCREEEISIEAPLPSDFLKILQTLIKNSN